ncbi:Rhodanese-like domain-containing protein [Chaetomium strumarium]|uniref:M-phase inducer phosphatase n=1 Tax=Chaetomium strumarium TaxID=1170767 RepID=A0AAJ0H0S7_9PEZI|nr:Rhodanese-like domain-containing protein [Chaetomium strumarium]
MMETSSPLAAIRPAPPSTFGQADLFGPHLVPSPLGRSQFAFHPQKAEYFNPSGIRGSSPGTSLAADLSQNFKLNDASPMFPNPRRALFTTAAMMNTLEGRGYVTTPPLPPSSSPGCAEMMEMSPLPHKGPFVTQVEIPSPTPGSDDTPLLESLESPGPSSTPLQSVADNRKRLGLRRPSLSRAKAFTSTGAGDPSQLGSSPTSCISMAESMDDSPSQERRPESADSPCAHMASARPKAQFNSLAGVSGVRNGSPITSHSRRTSNLFLRPRKQQYRRSLSMFENHGDAGKAKAEGKLNPCLALHSVMDLDEPQEPILPHFFLEDRDNIPRITRETMLDVLDGKYNQQFDHKMIIDCRFEYEYNGGHINGAVNYNDKELLAAQLVENPIEGRTLLIFHCEYSAHRAPLMARHVRAADRNAHAHEYPKLSYPEIYILDGGYSAFFSDHPERCYPQAYVEMNDAQHVNTCERELSRLRQNRRGLGRAQTYAL